MRIAYILTDFSPLSETFIRREVLALCERGHQLFVYAERLHEDPLSPLPVHPRLAVRQLPLSAPELAAVACDDGVEHLHGSLMLRAHHAAFAAALRLHVPYTVTAYSGHSVFTAQDPALYGELSNHELCSAVVVEDRFMKDWLIRRLGANPHKIEIIPNSLDLNLYLPGHRKRATKLLRILSIARFFEKKGLAYLVEAFLKLRTRRDDVELHLIGSGPEEEPLRQAAGGDPAIHFLGARPESECRQAYEDSDIFCLPCVRAEDGDADGVPTTILEAMAMKLPVVTSDLLSMPQYVRHGKEGFLAPPGDSEMIAKCLELLCADAGLRRKMGRKGRRQAEKLCDLQRNISKLEDLLKRARQTRWKSCMKELARRAGHYDGATLDYYDQKRAQGVEFFRPWGRFLDIGCENGETRFFVSPEVSYFGCDPMIPLPQHRAFPFAAGIAEALPFATASFDSALLKSVLSYALDIDMLLAEASRILKPGGRLFLHECINDLNPVHLNHLSDRHLRERIAQHLQILEFQIDQPPELALIIAQKPFEKGAQPAESARPLVSIAITAYNREAFLRQAIDSALRQTYAPIEVVIVDDGSTDATWQIIQEYADRIRALRHRTNRGIAAAKRRALKMTAATARYVCMLDSDDYFDPRFVELCVHYLENHPSQGLAYVDYFLMDSEGKPAERIEAIDPWCKEDWLRDRRLCADSWLARRDLVMQTDLHDVRMPMDEDYDLFYQLLELTTFGHVAESLLYVRQHPEQLTKDKLMLARCHAANLVKYGYSPMYAYHRARQNPEWLPAIEEGIALGMNLRVERQRRHGRENRKPRLQEKDTFRKI